MDERTNSTSLHNLPIVTLTYLQHQFSLYAPINISSSNGLPLAIAPQHMSKQIHNLNYCAPQCVLHENPLKAHRHTRTTHALRIHLRHNFIYCAPHACRHDLWSKKFFSTRMHTIDHPQPTTHIRAILLYTNFHELQVWLPRLHASRQPSTHS